MKSVASLLLVGAVVCLASCSKKEKTAQQDPASFRVKTIQHSKSGLTDTYIYTGDNKIQAINYSDGSKVSYEYADSTLIEQTFDAAGSLQSTRTMKLDEQGRVAESAVTNSE